MDTTKTHGFFLAGFLFFMFLGDLTEACICGRMSIRRACCREDFVMRTKFMSISRNPIAPYMWVNIYTIQPIEVYKGPWKVGYAKELYTSLSETYCGYTHKGPLQGDDYLISGTIESYGRLHISMCSFAESWEKVNKEQKKKLEGFADKGCSNILS